MHGVRWLLGLTTAACVAVAAPRLRSGQAVHADTLPAGLSDAAFWRLITDLSEPAVPSLGLQGVPYENLVSNEIGFQQVIPALKQRIRPGGVYVGVGPEQNFTYVAALQPKMAFVIDIRRQNMLELLMYKAIFEMSEDRAEFVSRLFARARPWRLRSEALTAADLFRAYARVFPSDSLFLRTLAAIQHRLVDTHGFPLSETDRKTIEVIYKAFATAGPSLTYAYPSLRQSANARHTYQDLMTAADGNGKAWSYLATEDQFRYVRGLQQRNLIVPVVGDFAGPKVIEAVGKYVKQQQAAVNVFYTSNVEEYIRKPLGNYTRFCSSVASLPIDESSTFIRWTSGPAPRTFLSSMSEFVEAFTLGRPLPFDIRGRNGRLLAQVSCN
jgi:hypothetical protein